MVGSIVLALFEAGADVAVSWRGRYLWTRGTYLFRESLYGSYAILHTLRASCERYLFYFLFVGVDYADLQVRVVLSTCVD